jgi:uncharacterized protein (TIGR00299 family) protein
MPALLFDPFAGISGDMMLGALVDLGLGEDWLRKFVKDLGLGPVGVRVDNVRRRGIACAQVSFDLPHAHAHRHLRNVLEIIDGSGASEGAKARAVDAFHRLAEAEAEVHGTSIEKVHFHEVGALDAILDVLGAMSAVEALGFDTFFTRSVAVGSGWIEIEHGRFPVPAPATLKLLQGIELTGLDLAGECTTPTGAAILATLTGGRKAPAGITVLASGFGAGSRDPEDRPNCLRLISCETDVAHEELLLVQTDVDDMPAEYAPAALDAAVAAGALDAVVSHVGMKKGRPGLRIEALVPAAALDAVIGVLFRATPTIGLRYWPVTRPALPRAEDVVEWRGQRIRRKRVRLPGGTERAKPEYEDVVRAANALGMTPFEVRQALDDGSEAP